MAEKEFILIIGVRRKCYQAALDLGYNVLLWSDGPLHDQRKKGLSGWLEQPYSSSKNELSAEVKNFLDNHNIKSVIANSEETVLLGAMARRALNLKPLGYKVTERFHNKFVMKNSAKQADIPITKYKLIEKNTTPEDLIDELNLPIVIKPVDESGAQDIKVAHTKSDLKKLMKEGLLAEAFVDGVEMSVETFVQDGQSIFHNCTEYLHQWRKSVIPATLDKDLEKEILNLNDRVIKHFKLDRGMTHAEFYLTKNGPVFGEIAVRPPGGYYMDLIEKVYGFDPWEVYVELSCGKKVEIPSKKAHGNAAVVMFHPGSGKVVSIRGESEVKSKLLNIIDFRIRKKPGDMVDHHTNTSNETGHILFWEKKREDLLKSIEYVEDNVCFVLENPI